MRDTLHPSDPLSDSEQTLADSDQTLSDADQTSADSDQTSADSDQAAADHDQAASDRDLLAGGDVREHTASREIREHSALHREETADERERGARARLAAAEQRDLIADARDVAALGRDESASARDEAMARRDITYEREASPRAITGADVLLRAAGQRKRAAQHRTLAAEQRMLAAEDRKAAEQDRELAAAERRRALADREILARRLAIATTERRRTPLNLDLLLSAVEAAPPISAARVLGVALTDTLDAREVSFLIADYSGRSLIRLSHVARGHAGGGSGRERTEAVPLLGTPHGRALMEQEVVVVADDRGSRLFAPVTNRGEAVGVLELALDEEPDEQTLADVARAAHAFAYIVIANRRFTDLYEWGQRSVPLSLEAEIQHRLLPGSYTCEAGQFTLAGWLEPAGDVGGDTFDFSVDRDTLHLSMTDAMGHTLEAALLATVLVGALRNARRRAVGLAEQARLADAALASYATNYAFVTGQLVRVDLALGVARIVNAGHPPPIRVRDGRAEEIALKADPPFGLRRGDDYRVQDLLLQPGDRVVLLTDGMLERNATAVDVFSILTDTRHLHPREAVQALTRAVVHACGGDLRDDATVLCFDWHGGPPRERDASAGADR
jgi:serine phosphatase RsbU (regulator of sigma subunit)